jgi:hypothetical protein
MHSLKKGINVGLSETKMGFPQTGWETPSPVSVNSERKILQIQKWVGQRLKMRQDGIYVF